MQALLPGWDGVPRDWHATARDGVRLQTPRFGWNCRVEGSYCGSPQDLRALVPLAQSGKLRLGNVKARPMAEAQQSLEDLAAGRVVGRQVLVV